ncbi:hypothetical protein MBOU_21020 [Mycobacterium bourgelatii]|uniref:Uncharacterized protein n=1 Tax=Mycobacterium bourgelatii TaxID=1273442 RepID=A0A7I9YN11_MYCBU|nr:hypothetical protein MBOU_21020 [Mycobacterium bourgelatii]
MAAVAAVRRNRVVRAAGEARRNREVGEVDTQERYAFRSQDRGCLGILVAGSLPSLFARTRVRNLATRNLAKERPEIAYCPRPNLSASPAGCPPTVTVAAAWYA